MNEPLSEPVAPASGFEREHQRLDRQLRAHLLAVVGADFSAAHDKLTRWQRALLRHIENRGWNEAFAAQASALIERAQRLSPANPRLTAITEFMHELMKRFGIAPSRPQPKPRPT